MARKTDKTDNQPAPTMRDAAAELATEIAEFKAECKAHSVDPHDVLELMGAGLSYADALIAAVAAAAKSDGAKLGVRLVLGFLQRFRRPAPTA